MKKYLFGLGAMLVGAGLMFVLMHGEVSAEIGKVYDKPEPFVCSEDNYASVVTPSVFHCETWQPDLWSCWTRYILREN